MPETAIIETQTKDCKPDPAMEKIEKNISAYGVVFEICLKKAREIGKKEGLNFDEIERLSNLLFNRFYDDQIDMRAQQFRNRQDPALLEIVQRLMHRI